MAALPTLQQLRYLVTLSEELHFTRAAERCFVTQSTLSAGLRELEQALGVTLVERDRHGVRMTAEGLDAVARAGTLLAGARDLVEAAAATRAPMSALVRLGAIPTIAPFLLPGTLALLRRRHPGAKIALREDLTANLLQRLAAGELDFAVIALPYDTGELRVEPLFEDELFLVGRRDDEAVRATPVGITRAVTDRLLLLEEGHCLREHSLAACRPSSRSGAGAASGGIEATSLLTLLEMIESGMGVGLVPRMAVRARGARGAAILGRTLVARPVRAPAPRRTVALVARRTSARLRDFDVIAQALRETGGTP